jgi:hypothetical protein
MFLLLASSLFLQAGGAAKETGPVARSGVEVGAVFLRLDDALGAESKIVQGVEFAFQMSKPMPEYTIGFRAYYRRWDVTFEEFNQLPADLDGELQQLGLDLVVTYPLTGPLTLGVELGGGAQKLEHDLDKETSAFFEGGAFLRLDLFAGLYIEAAGGAFAAFTEFGGQEADTDHVSWTGRLNLGLEINF